MGTLTSTNIRSPLFSRKQSGGVFSVVNETLTTGNIYYVDSGQTTTGGTGASYGRNPDAPFTTVAAALAQCTAANGDMIFVMPGHAETLTTAMNISTAGVSIIGLGNGDNRPIITSTATAAPTWNVRAHDIRISNIKFYNNTTYTTYARTLMRIAADDIEVSNCEFNQNRQMLYTVKILSGNKVAIKDCVFINTTHDNAGVAGIKAQHAILNIGGTNVLVKNCRFNDEIADAAHKWKVCVAGGKLTATMSIEDCTFICHGIATATRSAAASGLQYTLFCRGISPSAVTAAAAIFTPTYQYVMESYVVAVVNVQSLHATSTSDIRLKTGVAYL